MRHNRKNKYGFYAKFSKYRDNDISISRYDAGNYPCLFFEYYYEGRD